MEVQAIKTSEHIEKVKVFLEKHHGMHFRDIFELGINLALRVGDLLSLSMDDARDMLKDGHLFIKEQKTRNKVNVRIRSIKVNQSARKVLERRLEANPDDQWLFQSHGNNAKAQKRPLGTKGVYNAFREAGTVIDRRLGTHTMRKTRGYALHNAGMAIEKIARMFNHENTRMTMRYIGLEQEEIDQSYDDFEL